jgi:TonB family protein
MRRDDVILTVALCASLLFHGLLAVGLAWSYGKQRIYLPGVEHEGIAIAAVDPDSIFGKADGAGNAANAMDLDREMLGRQAPSVQAFLSKDPAGPGKVGVEPTMNVLPEGDEGAAASAREVQAPAEPLPRQPAVMPSAPDVQSIGTDSSLVDFAAPYRKVQPPVKKPVAKAAGGNPGSNAPAADPAPMTDSESDAFRETGSVEVSAGKVDARLGREVKTVRPRLSYVAYTELYATQSRSMRVRLHLDSAGKVTKLDIVKSSGSETADQEAKLALYKWEFDPRPKRIPDMVEFDLIWR